MDVGLSVFYASLKHWSVWRYGVICMRCVVLRGRVLGGRMRGKHTVCLLHQLGDVFP